jgi:hypothetical protein
MSASRRHRGPEQPLVIKGFADAVSAAMGMVDRFPRGHGVIVTARRGLVLELLMFTDEEHTAEDAIAAGIHVRTHSPLARRMVLVSVLQDVDLQVPNELDVEMWRSAVTRCARAGLELWEWIVTSNELIRSLSMTAETEPEWRTTTA